MRKKLKITLGFALAILIIAGIVIGNIWTHQNKQDTKTQNKRSSSSDSELDMSSPEQCRKIIEEHASYEDEQVLKALQRFCQYTEDPYTSLTLSDTDWQAYYDIYYNITKRRLDKAFKALGADSEPSGITKYTLEKSCSPEYQPFYDSDADILRCFIKTATKLSQFMQIKALYDLCDGQYNRASAGYTQCLCEAMRNFFAYTEIGYDSLMSMTQAPEDYQALMSFLNWHLSTTYDPSEYFTSLWLYLQLNMEQSENHPDIPPLINFPDVSALPLPDGISTSDVSDVLPRDINNDGNCELILGFSTSKLPEGLATDEETFGYGIIIFSQDQQTGTYKPMTLANGSDVYYHAYDGITYTDYDVNCSITEKMALEVLGF